MFRTTMYDIVHVFSSAYELFLSHYQSTWVIIIMCMLTTCNGHSVLSFSAQVNNNIIIIDYFQHAWFE